MNKCPNCQQKLNPFSLSFAAFPVYFKCNGCKTRLTLKRVKAFWLTYLLYSVIILPIVVHTPFINNNNLGLPVMIAGAFVLYYFVANYLLRQENVAIYK
ncbi:hypothetical protein AN214_00239 [Pseudoalteromonas sp. P1-9]|uniref:hypothetical protein n=1 Tax=Pseudoalteromonas sp. P1-9 TaxID=1710354 RepID=UPI0006D5E56B|nr:hypothetical protein [Pseudoalteromonas sp. P1-9]KPV98478.1 hypothetical protein AN214_00239 [Pseudoalteromonas sp. P1-9]